MGRKKHADGPLDKLSVMLPPELHQQVERYRVRRGINLSTAVRELLAMGLLADRQQQGPRGINPGASPTGIHGEGEFVLTVCLTGGHRDCLQLASELLDLDPGALVQLILTENLAAYVERGRQKQEELRRLIGRGGQRH
jgi:hypothetical protein